MRSSASSSAPSPAFKTGVYLVFGFLGCFALLSPAKAAHLPFKCQCLPNIGGTCAATASDPGFNIHTQDQPDDSASSKNVCNEFCGLQSTSGPSGSYSYCGVLIATGAPPPPPSTSKYCYCKDKKGVCKNSEWIRAGEAAGDGACQTLCSSSTEYRTPHLWTSDPVCDYVAVAEYGVVSCTIRDLNNSACGSKPCFCKFKDDYSVAACRGLTTYVGNAAGGPACDALCVAPKYVPYRLAGNKNDFCDFQEANGCKEPTNPKTLEGSACHARFVTCFCKYPSQHKPVGCANKTTAVGSMFPEDVAKCKGTCEDKGLLHVGLALPTEYCDYKDSNGCVQATLQIFKGDVNMCPGVGAIEEGEIPAASKDCPPGSPPGSVCLVNPTATTRAPKLAGNILNAALGLLGSFSLLMLIYGGLTWLTSGGVPEKVQKGKSIFTWAFIGLLTIFGSYALVRFVLGAFTGL
jgi:hypothetical protein